MKLCMYIMAPEPISTTYFINPSHTCMCIPLSLLGNDSVKTLTRQRTHTQQYNCYKRRFLWGPCRIKESRRLELLLFLISLFYEVVSVHTIYRRRQDDYYDAGCGMKAGWGNRSTTLSINCTWSQLGLNPGCRGEEPELWVLSGKLCRSGIHFTIVLTIDRALWRRVDADSLLHHLHTTTQCVTDGI
jgi:hypothetical protein